jgi:Xaa-Pro aminopeptidase
VTESSAFLWTDGRYTVQAKKQLYVTTTCAVLTTNLRDAEHWHLMQIDEDIDLSIKNFLTLPADEKQSSQVNVNKLAAESNIGIDPFLSSSNSFKSLRTCLKESAFKHKLISITPNLVDAIWDDRPSLPSGKIFALPLEFSGENHTSKIAQIRKKMTEKKCDKLILTMLDEIACT